MSDVPFAQRHIGPSADDQQLMLKAVGYESVDDLINAAIPASIRWRKPLNLPLPASEAEVLGELRALAAANRPLVSMIGLGYHGTHTPPVILRNVLENPAWYTAYTPYQPEISQGRLEALLNFQTVVADLTGLPVATVSASGSASTSASDELAARRARRRAG